MKKEEEEISVISQTPLTFLLRVKQTVGSQMLSFDAYCVMILALAC